MRRIFVAALTTIALVPALVSAGCGSDDPPAATATATPAQTTPAGPAVTFHTRAGTSASLSVEIADTVEKRAVGLMNRESLAEDAGMLFAWPEDTESGFWMKDTLIPLSIAFIDATGVIVDIQDMQPRDETLHYSSSPYRHAVEANQGWFAEHGIEAGDTVDLPAEAG
ncbi:MAG TPA: DUF192 domain-containing protein [Dehalococcoidia bacterium]|nr:DUF192 domain-containing protein [Dehalococcoidia bacterium]